MELDNFIICKNRGEKRRGEERRVGKNSCRFPNIEERKRLQKKKLLLLKHR